MVLPLALTACSTEPPINGRWTLSRVVTSQPPEANCAPLANSTDIVAIEVGATTELAVERSDGTRAPAWSLNTLTDTAVEFVAEEYGLLSSQPSWPMLIDHELELADDRLLGTGQSRGDDIYLGCTWGMTIVGTRL